MAQSLSFKNERSGRVLTEESSFTGGMHFSDTALDAPYLKSVVNMDYDTITTNLKTRKPFVPVNVISEDIANLEFLCALEVPVQNYIIKHSKTCWASDATNTVYLFGKQYQSASPTRFAGTSLNTTTVVDAKTLGRTHINLYDMPSLLALMVDENGVTHECKLTSNGLVDGSVFPRIITYPSANRFLLRYGNDAPMLTVYGKYVIAPTLDCNDNGAFSFITPDASGTPSLTAFQFYALRDEADMSTTQVLYSYTHFSQTEQSDGASDFDIKDTLSLQPMASSNIRSYHIAPVVPTGEDYTALNTLMSKVLIKDHWEGFDLLSPSTLATQGCSFNNKADEVHAHNSNLISGELYGNANYYATTNPVQGTDFELTLGPDAFLTVLSIGKLSITVGTPYVEDRKQYYRFTVRYMTEDIGECVIDEEQLARWKTKSTAYDVSGFRHNLHTCVSWTFTELLGAFWKYQFRNNQMYVWFRHENDTDRSGDYALYWTDLRDGTKSEYLNIPADALKDISGDTCQVHLWFHDETHYREFSSSHRRTSTCLIKEFEMHRPLLYNLIPHTDTYTYPTDITYEDKKLNIIKTLDDYIEYIVNIRRQWSGDVADSTEYLRELDTAIRYYSIIFKRLEASGEDPDGLRYKLPVILPDGWNIDPTLKDAYAYYSFPVGSWNTLLTDMTTYSLCVDYNSKTVGHLKFAYRHPNLNDGTAPDTYSDYVLLDNTSLHSVNCSRDVDCLFGVSLFNMSPYKLATAFKEACAEMSAHTASTADVFKELRTTSITTAKNNAYNLVLGNDMYTFISTADLSANLAPVVQGVYMQDPDEEKVVVTPKVGQYVRLVPVIRLPSNYTSMSTYVRVLWQYTTANTATTDAVWSTISCFGKTVEEVEALGLDYSTVYDVKELGQALIDSDTPNEKLSPLFMITDEAVLVRCTLELYSVSTKLTGTYKSQDGVQREVFEYSSISIGTSIANLTIEPAAYQTLAKAPANLATAQGSTVWNNQLFLWGVYSNSNTLFWSEVDNPCYFPYPINSHEFDMPIRALIPYKTGLIAFTADACYRLDAAEKGFTVTCIQRGLDIAVEDAKFIKFIKNMVLFKSGPYFYMVVPKATTYYTGELAIAPIYKTIQKFFDESNTTITSVLCDMYPEQSDYITQLTTETPWELLDSHIEQDVAVLRYGVEAADGLYFSLRYDTTSRQWTAYFDVVAQGTAHVHAYELGNAQEYVVYRNSTEGTRGLKSLYTYTYSTDSIKDTSYAHGLPERYFIDTGYRKLTEALKKRFRELQFRLHTPENTELKFRTKFYVDGTSRRDYDKYSGELIEDSIGGKTYILTHDYLDFNVFATDTINPDEDGLEGWTLDFSEFAADSPIKVRMACSGKGYLPRLTILSTTNTPFELSGINWVYRVMNGR